jgi:hypothetical protein
MNELMVFYIVVRRSGSLQACQLSFSCEKEKRDEKRNEKGTHKKESQQKEKPKHLQSDDMLKQVSVWWCRSRPEQDRKPNDSRKGRNRISKPNQASRR